MELSVSGEIKEIFISLKLNEITLTYRKNQVEDKEKIFDTLHARFHDGDFSNFKSFSRQKMLKDKLSFSHQYQGLFLFN